MIDCYAKRMNLSWDEFVKLSGLSRPVVMRRLRDKKPLVQHNAEQVVMIGVLLGQVEAMVEESGRAEGFEAGRWLAQWLNAPNGALGFAKPASYLNTREGASMISNLLGRMVTGAYS